MKFAPITRQWTQNKMIDTLPPSIEKMSEKTRTSHQNGKISDRLNKIAISSSTSCSFYTQKTIRDVSKYLQSNGFAGMFWNEQDEALKLSVYRLCLRLRILEKCKIVVVFLTKDYFDNLYSFLEFKLILYRKDISVVLVETETVNREHSFFKQLEQTAKCLIEYHSDTNDTLEELGGRIQENITELKNHGDLSYILGEESSSKKVELWSTQQVIAWMGTINIPDDIISVFRRQDINGTLFSAITESDLSSHLNIGLNQIRKRILCSRDSLLRASRPPQNAPKSNNNVFILYHSSDAEKHEKIVQILQLSAFQISSSLDVKDSCSIIDDKMANSVESSSLMVLVLTQNVVKSRDWLNVFCYAIERGVKVVGAVCETPLTRWTPMLLSLLNKAILIEFGFYLFDLSEEKLLRVRNLLRWIKSHRRVENWPGTCRREIMSINECLSDELKNERKSKFDVVLFFHWDQRSHANQVEYLLAKNKISCWSELNFKKEKFSNKNSLKYISYNNFFRSNENLNQSIESVVVTCSVVVFLISSDYICGQNFQNDLKLAVKLDKQIIFVLAEICLWPPLFASKMMRRIAKLNLMVDLSNEAMFQRNQGSLVKYILQKLSLVNCLKYNRLNTYNV